MIAKDIERAEREVVIPERAAKEQWGADEAQRWAKHEVLFGGPPDMPEDPKTDTVIKWDKIKDYAGRKVRIRARPMGLILTYEDGTKRFVPGDASPSKGSSGFAFGTGTEEMRRKTKTETTIRDFAKIEVERYNKRRAEEARASERRTATREFWESGKRIREFLARNLSIAQDQVWYALEQWGRGEYGYGKRWLEYATYFYDWRKNAESDDPSFALSETKVMLILMAGSNSGECDNLLEACLNGFLSDLSDEELKWTTGRSRGTFPLSDSEFSELRNVGCKINAGQELDNGDMLRLQNILETSRRHPEKEQDAQGDPDANE